MRVEHRYLRLAGERDLAGQAFEQQAPQRVDVGPAVNVLAADLLGRHVMDRSQRSSHRAAGRLDRQLAEAEVGQVCPDRGLTALFDHQDVARLDVSVDEPQFVRRVECARDLLDDRHDDVRRQRPAVSHACSQVAAGDVAHRDVQQLLNLAGVEDRDHVRMLEAGGDLRLAQEASAEHGIAGQVRRHDLQRDLTAQPRLLRSIYAPHAAPPDQ